MRRHANRRTAPDRVPDRMRALVYRGVDDLRVESLPVPRIASGEVLVRVAACGVCPTDIKKIRLGTVPPPRVFGHEMAGTIVRAGARVRGFQERDRVAMHHHVPCGHCHFCQRRAFAQCPTYLKTGVTAGFEPAGGGYSEYVRVLPFCIPGLVRIPRRNSFAEAAMLEPVNTVLKGVRLLGVHPGDEVLVVGQGPIGLLFNRLLTLAGAGVTGCDPLPHRARLGRRFGAVRCFASVEEAAGVVPRITRGRGLDAVVLTVPSNPAFAEGHRLVRGGGTTLVFGHTVRGSDVPVDLGRVCVDEQRILGSYSADVQLQRTVARLVFGRQLDVRPLISHRFPLAKAAEAIALAASPSGDMLKLLVEPQADGSAGAT
ncbi:MAG: alcohol dehydrogenase catalytic domain-containing protein [Verrucomicrobiae bacterium]|nr:alcohol dehydrogenase catalytic domain-containing protein [Verrucomicrobiae bacterium]